MDEKPHLHILPKESGKQPDDGDVPFIADVSTHPKKVYSDHPAHHLLPSFARIMEAGYYPTMDDILSLRVPTTGK